MRKPRTTLDARQRRFIDEYLVDLNGSKAAVRAGYAESSAATRASRLLKMTQVADAVREAMDARAQRTQITADRVLREYARIAFADIRSFTEPGSTGLTVKSLETLSDDDTAAIAEVSRGANGQNLKVKLHDKKKALDSIARHLGLFGKQAARGESPAAAAQRVRELILARLARLARPDGSK